MLPSIFVGCCLIIGHCTGCSYYLTLLKIAKALNLVLARFRKVPLFRDTSDTSTKKPSVRSQLDVFSPKIIVQDKDAKFVR